MIPINNPVKRLDAGLPIDYDSESYTISNQLKELQSLNLHQSDSSEDLEDDTSNSTHNNAQSLPNFLDKGFDSDNSNPFEMSYSEQTHRSLTESIFANTCPTKHNQNEYKYDHMEPLTFDAQPIDCTNNNNTKRESSPTANGHKSLSSSPETEPIQPQRRNSLPTINPPITQQNTTRCDEYKIEIGERDNSDHELEIKHGTNRVNNLMNDIWWLLDTDDELKQYKNMDNDYRNDMLILFKSFNLMNDGNRICYTFCKLLGWKIYDFALTESVKYVTLKQWTKAINAYNVIIRFCDILKEKQKLHLYYLKRSECYFNICEYEKAICDAEQSYKCNITFEKGYIMHGKILMTLHDYDKAKRIYVLGHVLNGKYKKKFSNGIQNTNKHMKLIVESKKIDVLHLNIENENKDENVCIDIDIETVSYKKMTQQIEREIDMECNKWNNIVNVNVYKNSQSIYIEAIRHCNFIDKCQCTKRVIFLMQIYLKWLKRYVNYLSLNELMDKICKQKQNNGYFYKDLFLLYNDYVHIIDKHINNGDGDNENWKFLTKQLGICENDSSLCDIFKRHFRNKNISITSIKERNNKYFGFVESKYIALIQLFDQIHCHFTHCNPFCVENVCNSIFDVYIKGNKDNFNNNNNNEECKCKKQYDTNYSSNLCLHNKFISHINTKLGMQFGTQFVYWKYFEKATNYCLPRYKSLKSEVLNNNIYCINKYVWNDLLIKAKWIQMSYLCKKTMNAKDKGLENKKLNIKVGCPISLSHIIVLLLMSNYIELRNKFVEFGCNYISMDETIENVKNRNREIGNFCKLLYECVLFYGKEMKQKQYFYYGIDHRLLFNSYHLSFKQPISTTSLINTIKNVLQQQLYVNKPCIVLKYGLSDSYGCPYFDVSKLFSNNPYEKEFIFFNCKLQIYDILYLDEDYGDENKKILQSNHIYIQALIYFEKIVKGYFVSCDYDGKTRKLYEKIVTKMIDNFLHPSQNSESNDINYIINKPQMFKNLKSVQTITKIVENVLFAKRNSKIDKRNSKIEIPDYIQSLFRFYCENMDELWLIKSELSSLSDELRKYFIDNINNNFSSNNIMIDSSNPDSYGTFLKFIETNHRGITDHNFINFVNEYVWYINKNTFNEFLSLKCNQSMTGPKIHVKIAYFMNSFIGQLYSDNTNNDVVVFEPNCYRSLKFAPQFGAFGLTIKQLPRHIDKIKFEYQVYCKSANYILLVPSGKKWFKKGDHVGFKSFKSQIVTSNITKEFSYRFTVKIIQIHKKLAIK